MHNFDFQSKTTLCIVGQQPTIVRIVALLLFLGLPRIHPNPSDHGYWLNRFAPNPLYLRLRGGTDCREARPKADPQILRKLRGEDLEVLDGREIEGPMQPVPPQTISEVLRRRNVVSK